MDGESKRYIMPAGWERMGEVVVPTGETLPLYLHTGAGEGGVVPFDRFAVQMDGGLYCIDVPNDTRVRYSGLRVDADQRPA